MLAAKYNGSGLELQEKPKPTIDPTQALVRVEAAAICGTDLRIIEHGHSNLPEGKHPVLGHEFVGEVVEVGDEVDSSLEGQRVVVAPVIGCGKCEQCLAGNNHKCPDYRAIGIAMDGGFAEYFRVPSEAIERGNLATIPENLSYKEAVVTEPLATSYQALKVCDLRMNDVVLVIGAGPMGLFHTMLARLGGASKVIVSEIVESRRKLASELGADLTFDPTEGALPEYVKEITGGHGADIGVVAVPSARAQVQAIKSAAIEGRVHFFGTLPEEESIKEFPSNLLHYRQVYVTGSSGTSNSNLRETLKIMASGRLPVGEVITDEYPLEQIDEAIDRAGEKSSLKVTVWPRRRAG